MAPGDCFDKYTTENNLQKKPCSGPLYQKTHLINPLDAKNKGQGMFIWHFQDIKLHF